MTVFAPYDHLPLPLRGVMYELELFIGGLDGKVLEDDETIDAEEAVVAFNKIVAVLTATINGQTR